MWCSDKILIEPILQQERRRSRLESDAKIVLEVGTMLANPLLLRTSSMYAMREDDDDDNDAGGDESGQ